MRIAERLRVQPGRAEDAGHVDQGGASLLGQCVTVRMSGRGSEARCFGHLIHAENELLSMRLVHI